MPKKFEVKTREKTLKNGKTVYQYFFYGPNINNKRKEYSKSGFKTAKEAKKAGEKALSELIGSGFKNDNEKEMISVNDFINDVWFPGKTASKNWQLVTINGYRKRINNNILPYVGHYPLAGVNSIIIQNLINDLYYNKKRSINTVSDIHGMIGNIFRYAYNLGYIDKSPVDLVTIPKVDSSDENKNKLMIQYRDVIPSEKLDAIFKRFPEGSSCYIPMMLALFASMRLGECFGLIWDDVDFENNVIHIRRQMQTQNGLQYLCNPKYNSKRSVPMCQNLKNILLREKLKQENYKCLYNYYILKAEDGEIKNTHGVYNIYADYADGCEKINFVNIYPNSSFVSPDVMKHASRIIHGYSSNKKVKEKDTPIYENFNFHSLRHTFCSNLFNQDVNPAYIGVLMGHKNKEGVGRTTSRYLYIPYEKLAELTDKLNNIYTPK